MWIIFIHGTEKPLRNSRQSIWEDTMKQSVKLSIKLIDMRLCWNQCANYTVCWVIYNYIHTNPSYACSPAGH